MLQESGFWFGSGLLTQQVVQLIPFHFFVGFSHILTAQQKPKRLSYFLLPSDCTSKHEVKFAALLYLLWSKYVDAVYPHCIGLNRIDIKTGLGICMLFRILAQQLDFPAQLAWIVGVFRRWKSIAQRREAKTIEIWGFLKHHVVAMTLFPVFIGSDVIIHTVLLTCLFSCCLNRSSGRADSERMGTITG